MAYTTDGGSIDVHFGTMSDSYELLIGHHNKMVADHEDLLAQVNNLLGSGWNSNASGAYSQAQQQWSTSADALHGHLRQLATILANSHDNYRSTDTAIANGLMM